MVFLRGTCRSDGAETSRKPDYWPNPTWGLALDTPRHISYSQAHGRPVRTEIGGTAGMGGIEQGDRPRELSQDLRHI